MNHTTNLEDIGIGYYTESNFKILSHYNIFYADFLSADGEQTHRFIIDQFSIDCDFPCETVLGIYEINSGLREDIYPIGIWADCDNGYQGASPQTILVEQSGGTGHYTGNTEGVDWFLKLSLKYPNSSYQLPCLTISYLARDIYQASYS